MILSLTKQIDNLQSEIESVIQSNQGLFKIFELITSIKCIGTQTSLHLIVYTNAFTKFKNARKFASYCGIAPFPNRSGTSIRGKTKVSHLANKKVKCLLDLCAKSSICYNQEMMEYYHRRVVDEGKNKMSTINIIRNKLLSRVFSVVIK
jgi:transposase